MKGMLQKIVLFIAVVTVMGHTILPHIHHNEISVAMHHLDEQPSGKHHHDEEGSRDQQHHLFSFAQLDENFVPANGYSKSFEIPFEYVATAIITFDADSCPVNSKTHFGWYREFPPPDSYSPNLFSRPPPGC
jgi:hypothetical protein